MKRILLAGAMTVIVVAMVGGTAFAASSTVSVSASVTGKCIVNLNATGTIPQMTLDPSLTSGTVSGTITYAQALRCTKGYSTFSTSFTPGAGGYNLSNGPDKIAYVPGFAYKDQSGNPVTQGLGFGSGNEIDLSVTATVTNGTYADVAAGTYSDVFTVTVTP